MKILLVHYNHPGHALAVVADFLRRQKHETTLRIPIATRKSQFKAGLVRQKVDLAISAEPFTILNFLLSRLFFRSIGKVIFWRIDYYPWRYFWLSGLLNKICVLGADETWSMVEFPPYKYVPFLLAPKDYPKENREPRIRENCVMWSGPDLSSALPEVQQAVDSLDGQVKLVSSGFNRDKGKIQTLLTEDVFLRQMCRAKVGLVLHKGRDKFYSDPSRAKRFLACGVPLVMTATFPFSREVSDSGAGVIVNCQADSIRHGISWCLSNFPSMSERAKILAKKYEVSEDWINL